MNIKALDQVIASDYAIYHGDACELIRAVPDNSVHYGVHSPPFEGLYKFTNSDRDVSNNEGTSFWEHYQFLITELLRVTRPGRLHSVHVMQLPKALYDQHTTPMQSHINVGFGFDVTITEVAQTIAQTVGYTGQIEFDNTKPDGAPRKWMDSSRLNNLGWQAKVNLRVGLDMAYTDFRKTS